MARPVISQVEENIKRLRSKSASLRSRAYVKLGRTLASKTEPDDAAILKAAHTLGIAISTYGIAAVLQVVSLIGCDESPTSLAPAASTESAATLQPLFPPVPPRKAKV